MSVTTVPPGTRRSGRTSRAVPFRSAAALIAIVFMGLFGAWRAILAPWIALPDGGDHGWRRTAELHVPADAASGVLMMGVGIAAVLLVIRPLRSSVLMAWMIQTLVIISVGVATSTLLQGQAGPVGAMMSGGAMLLLAVPLVLLHPERRAVLAGGASSTDPGPSMALKVAFTVVGVAALASTVATVWWRLTGGLFEDALEDDVVSLGMAGLSISLGCALCVRGRKGWSILARLVAGMVAYCVAVGLTIVLR